MIGLSRSSVSSPRAVQHLHEKQQENVERYTYKLDHVEDSNQIGRQNGYKPVTVIKQARTFTQYFRRENFLKICILL